MSYRIMVWQDSVRAEVEVQSGETLLDGIRRSGLYIHAPCGGKGVCGKCKVDVEGVGTVRACDYHPENNLEARIHAPSTMEILTESFWPDSEPVPDDLPVGEWRDLGLAVDVGTTTVVVFLEDLRNHGNLGIKSFPNPQQPYGADVVSRINYCREYPGGLDKLHRLIVDGIGSAGQELCRNQGIDPGRVARISIAGNPTMLHLMKGVNPESLAVYPFTPVFLEEQRFAGAVIGIKPFESAYIELLPSVSSYIGADITAGFSAIGWTPDDGFRLFLDIGTNGEIVLWNKDLLLTCATAAGPAFEGARISCGMAGVEGAVNSVYPDGSYETIGNKPPLGLCGSGLVDAVALLLERGAVDSSGYLAEDTVVITTDDRRPMTDDKTTDDRRPMTDDSLSDTPLPDAKQFHTQTDTDTHTLLTRTMLGNEFDLSSVVGHPSSIVLTPQDIREVQLAKGAIAAGVEVLMVEAGIGADDISGVYLAGGFGYALHDWSALRIGLIPVALGLKLIRAGNTAGLGARLWLHSGEFRDHVRELVTRMQYIELSGHPEFNDRFVLNMTF